MNANTIALFDLDHTLLPIDSDHEWIEYLVRHNLAGDPEAVKRRNQEIFDKYNNGILTIEESAEFVLSFLAMHSPYDLARYHEGFMQEVIRPNLHQHAIDVVREHHEAGDLCCLVSATNTWVIEPIARAFGFEHCIGTTPEYRNGRFTGHFTGVASYQEGKITRVEQWLKTMGLTLSDFKKSFFYSDSMNDLPLLEVVTHPVATNPQDKLREIAQDKNWKILDLFA